VGPSRLFDVYFAVDWSARATPSPAAPSPDALWIAERAAAPGGRVEETYWRERAACMAHLRARIAEHLAAGRRALVGFDFPFGYPAGYAAALGAPGGGPLWRRVWDLLAALVTDGPANRNNRFAVAEGLNARCGPGPGPLWGCPIGAGSPHLRPTSPGFPYPVGPDRALAARRLTERRAPGAQPCWKLYGVGSVGGQALVGIPALRALRDDPALTAVSRVWPFETGFTPAPTPAGAPAVVYAEIWPGIVPAPLDASGPIRDQAQTRAVTAWFAALDAAGRLGALLAPPAGLSAAERAACAREEGWILGL
jgi:hypothetical protein